MHFTTTTLPNQLGSNGGSLDAGWQAGIKGRLGRLAAAFSRGFCLAAAHLVEEGTMPRLKARRQMEKIVGRGEKLKVVRNVLVHGIYLEIAAGVKSVRVTLST